LFAAIILLFLAMFVAAIYADCDPDGPGIPDCVALRDTSGTIPYRNFWDPTRYFVCTSQGAETKPCPQGEGFMTSGGCVSWSVWDWEPVC
ncbi:hypothetical protein KR044_007796, partial [Drosophila immigrans]